MASGHAHAWLTATSTAILKEAIAQSLIGLVIARNARVRAAAAATTPRKAVTFAFAIVVFLLTHTLGIRQHGASYI